jgi:hypothetical protein
MALYAAYGANLDPALMGLLAPHSPTRGTGWLVGWRLTFGGEEHGWEGPLTTVVEDPLHQVFVALYDVPAQDESALDGWEGSAIGIYSKLRVRVATLEGDELAWLYVVDGYEGGLPSARVLHQIADASEKAGAPDDYVRRLRERPCRATDR